MNIARIAVVAGTFAILGSSTSHADDRLASFIRPSSYAVQAYVYYKPGYAYGSGSFWMTAEVFETYEEAEEYVEFLWFLDLVDWDKMLDELGFPNYIYVYGAPDFRIVPQYSWQQLTPGGQLPLLR